MIELFSYIPYVLNREVLSKAKVKGEVTFGGQRRDIDVPFFELMEEITEGEQRPEVAPSGITKGHASYHIDGPTYLCDLLEVMVRCPKVSSVSNWYVVRRGAKGRGFACEFFVCENEERICDRASIAFDREDQGGLPEIFLRWDYDLEVPLSADAREVVLARTRLLYKDYYQNSPVGRLMALMVEGQYEQELFGEEYARFDAAPQVRPLLLGARILKELRSLRRLEAILLAVVTLFAIWEILFR